MNLVCVDPAQVHLVWPAVKEGVRNALERGCGGQFEETERSVLSGLGLLWLAVQDKSDIRGTLVTELVKTDSGLQCLIVALHGENMREWFGFISEIEKFAREEGCSSIRVIGRRGWARVLRDYEQIGIVIEKDLR